MACHNSSLVLRLLCFSQLLAASLKPVPGFSPTRFYETAGGVKINLGVAFAFPLISRFLLLQLPLLLHSSRASIRTQLPDWQVHVGVRYR